MRVKDSYATLATMQEKSKIAYVLTVLMVTITIIGILYGITTLTNSRTTKNLPHDLVANSVTTQEDIPPPTPNTTLMFVGDIMLARGVASSVKKNFNDNFDLFLSTIPEIAKADIAFANLEGPISTRGKNVGSKYSFRFEPRVALALKNAGFDILSVANNHAGDWTLTAFTDTLAYLREVEIKTAGGGMKKSEAITPSTIEKNGVTFGFIGFTDVGPNRLAATDTRAGLLLASDPDFETIIKEAKTQTDILIVSFHWGEEYVAHTTKQTTLAHKAIDAGADIIVGHHPHVEQVTELYKNKLIIYSLGNFIFDQYFSPETMSGLAVSVIMNKNSMVSYKKHRVQLSKTFQPHFEEYQEQEFSDQLKQ